MKQLYPSLENLKTNLKSIPILDLLKYVLKNNAFKFDDLIFTQLCGVVMGPRLPTKLASIKMTLRKITYTPAKKNL